jgi:segregation and condensation protein A
MDAPQSYQVKLEVFEGPLDLLLFLIRKKKLDIHEIPMAVITAEYLKYLENKEQINLEREAEFLLIASLLIHIKSQMLLPRERAAADENEDPRQALVERLLDHQKIKAASEILRDREQDQMKTWQRSFLPPLSPENNELEFMEVSLFDLAEVFYTLMKRQNQESVQVIKGKDFSVKQKMEEILGVLRSEGYLDFLDYFTQQPSLEEALFSFICLLELIKTRIVVALQETLFSPIKIWLPNKELPI